MTPEQFYENLLSQINVPKVEMDSARKKRDELLVTLSAVARQRVGPARTFASGALASGTQINPLNDVDTVLELEEIPDVWLVEPRRAMTDMVEWLTPEIEGRLQVSTHAIKITFGDEGFTADIVIARNTEEGILLPECREKGDHRWIASHPERHAAQIRGRNAAWGSARFSRQVRILKHLNREWQLRDEPHERKPLSSHHLAALALAILGRSGSHAELTPKFLEEAAHLVREPLPDPSGVGDPLTARDPAYAAGLLAEAAEKTRRALSAPSDEAQRLLLEVFGRPSDRAKLVGAAPVSVRVDGALVGGAVGARSVRMVRSHGDH